MARQKMLTKEILARVPALYGQESVANVDDAIAYAKFFNPCGDGTWYMTEYNPEDGTAFGLVVLHGEREIGYFSIPELESIQLRWGLYIERDIHFKPTKIGECK